MDNLYMKGDLLQVYTKNSEIFEGHFYEMNNDKSKISLYEVKELPEGEKNEGVCHFYDSEIQNIVKLKVNNKLKHLTISEKECENILKISKKFVFINQIDNRYHEALEDLNQYSYIGLSTDGASMGRKCKMPFLVLSTPHQIYIFDIKVMQHKAFDAGLKKVLESEAPKKIVHDCRKISDCLFHKHNTRLSSVFDTQVADLFISRNINGCFPTTVKTLAECLNIYLGLQSSTIEEVHDIVKSTERPLDPAIKNTLAKNIAYLHRLSEVIHDQMMLPFRRGLDCFVENLRSCDDYKAWELCGKYNQIPKEFISSIEN